MNFKFLVKYFKEIIIGILLLTIICMIIFFKYKESNFNKKIAEQTVMIAQLEKNITRHSLKEVDSKNLNKFSEESNIDINIIKDDLKKVDAEIKSVSKISINSSGTSKTDVKSTSVIPNNSSDANNLSHVKCDDGKLVECPGHDPYKYMSNTQVLTLKETFAGTDVPIGNVSFSAWKEYPWNIDLFPREYNVVTVIGVDENNKNYAYSKFFIKINNENYELVITDAQTVEEKLQSKLRFNPRFLFGADVGLTINSSINFEMIPNLQLNLLSFDKTKVLPKWSFVGIGVGYSINNKNMSFVLSPVSYNIGKSLPLMQNIYIGPTISIDTSAHIGALIGLKLNL